MPYGTLKVDNFVYYTPTGDATVAISGLLLPGSPIISGVSGIFTTSVSGATVTGNTVNAGNITGVSGTFTTRISGATVTGDTVNASNINGVSGIFTTSVSGATVTGNAINGSNITGVSGVFTTRISGTTITGATGNVTTINTTSLYVSGTYSGNVGTVAALDINCATANYFVKTINGASTFTVSNVPPNCNFAFTLELTHTSGSITWFANVEWPGGTAPTLTTGKTHLFMFVTDDGGARWRASSLINYTN